MMKLAVDCRMLGSGGIGTFLSELIPYFLEKAECLFVGEKSKCGNFLTSKNASFCECAVRTFSLKELFSFPGNVLKEINCCDAFFSPYCNIPSGIKVPVFSTIHDVVFLDVPGLTGTAGKLIRKFFYRRAVKKSEEIFTVSEFSKERIQKNLPCAKKIKVVYNSAPAYLTEKDSLDESAAVKKFGDFILFVGNIKKHKGLKTLLDAFEKARSNGLKSKLLIVGNKDNFRTGDEETVGKLEADGGKNIVFTGKVSNARLKEIYRCALVLVQPSLYEGFGMPPLEAMTLGTPAVISDIPVFKEIYGDFPVVFFKTADSDDLCEKLLSAEQNPKKIDLGELKNRYSYKKSAETILLAITSVL